VDENFDFGFDAQPLPQKPAEAPAGDEDDWMMAGVPAQPKQPAKQAAPKQQPAIVDDVLFDVPKQKPAPVAAPQPEVEEDPWTQLTTVDLKNEKKPAQKKPQQQQTTLNDIGVSSYGAAPANADPFGGFFGGQPAASPNPGFTAQPVAGYPGQFGMGYGQPNMGYGATPAGYPGQPQMVYPQQNGMYAPQGAVYGAGIQNAGIVMPYQAPAQQQQPARQQAAKPAANDPFAEFSW